MVTAMSLFIFTRVYNESCCTFSEPNLSLVEHEHPGDPGSAEDV
jgi:hypothetical protein